MAACGKYELGILAARLLQVVAVFDELTPAL